MKKEAKLLAFVIAVFLVMSTISFFGGTGFSKYEDTDLDESQAKNEVQPSESLNDLSGYTIAVDPGHGGDDPGAIGPSGYTEAECALDIGLRLRDLLEGAGAEVLMTRTEDVTVSLSERVNIANNAGADIFVSIHNNAFDGTAQGIETYYYEGLPPDSKSADLSHNLQDELIDEIDSPDRGVKTANYHVLRETSMPASLTENMFIDNPDEEAKLMDPEVRQWIADAHYRAIGEYFDVDLDPPEDADFVLNDWSLSPETVGPGETVTGEGEVENVGEDEGTVSVDFYIDGEFEESTDPNPTLGPGQSEDLTFYVTSSEEGSYDVDTHAFELPLDPPADDTWSSTFTVEQDDEAPAPPENLDVEHYDDGNSNHLGSDASTEENRDELMGEYEWGVYGECECDYQCQWQFTETEEISPDTVEVGETVTISGEVQHYNADSHQQAAISLHIDDEEVDTYITDELGWHDTESFSFDRTKDSSGTYDVDLYIFWYTEGSTQGGWHHRWSSSFEVIEEGEPEFELSDWSASPSTVEPGESVTIQGDITNVGDETGDVSAELYIGGEYEGSSWDTLAAGETDTFTHTHSEDSQGQYHVEIFAWCDEKENIDDDWSGEFEVVEEVEIEVETVGTSEETSESATLEGEVVDMGGLDAPHNRLTWDASPDDAEGEVSHYNIYRSEDQDGSWDEPIDDVSADSSDNYEYIDEDSAGEPYYWYVVRAVGTNDVEEENTDSVQEPEVDTTVEVLFRYRVSGETTWEETEKEQRDSEGTFSEEISGLEEGTEYEFKAVGQWDGEEDTGEVMNFTTGAEDAEFVLDEWYIDPEEAGSGETITIEGEVENIGGEEEVSVELAVDGTVVQTTYPDHPVLGPGESEIVTFQHSEDEEGTYDVEVRAIGEDWEPSDPFDDTWESEFEVISAEHELMIQVEGDGTTDPEPGTHIYDQGEEVTIDAIPDDGWEFDNWTVEGETDTDQVNYGFWPYWVDPDEYDPDWDELTHISAFSMTAQSDGSLYEGNMHHYDDVADAAEGTDTEVTLTIAQFDPDIQDDFLEDSQSRQDLVDNIVDAIDDYDADGVNIDFEGVREENSNTDECNVDNMEDFFERLYDDVKEKDEDHHISFCTMGWVEMVYRNSQLSEYTDHVFMMGYDYHRAGSDNAGPVSPYDYWGLDVTDSMDTLRDYYPEEQLILGVPFYGYEWPVVEEPDPDDPITEAADTGESVWMTEAKDNADQHGEEWCDDSDSPWYAYREDGQWYQGWYDDEDSLEVKWGYTKIEGFGGTGFWAVGFETKETWDRLEYVFSNPNNRNELNEEGETLTVNMTEDKEVTAHFEEAIDLVPPTGLEVEKQEDIEDIEIKWNDVGALEYNVYHSEDQYEDLETWNNIGTVENTSYTHTDALGGENYYYVTSTDGDEDSERSSIVFSVEKSFEYHGEDGEIERHYVSIPMNFGNEDEFAASDLVEDIEGNLDTSEKIEDMVRWDPEERGYTEQYYFDGEGWTGDDFIMENGDGIGLGVVNDFDWNIYGSDSEHEITYGDERPRHYTSIPYTLADQTGDGELRASDLVMMIEGDLESREYISDVVRWDPANEDHDERFYYDDLTGEWVDDFEIEPGNGIGFSVESEFTWDIELISPSTYEQDENDVSNCEIDRYLDVRTVILFRQKFEEDVPIDGCKEDQNISDRYMKHY